MGGDTPKTLKPVGEKGPLLDYLIEGLKQAEVPDLMVVTGHRYGEVESYVTEKWGSENLTFVRNMRYASWGNFHSVRVAVDQSPGFDLMVVNCDIVTHPEVYRRVIESEGELILSVQKRDRLDTEDMRVQLDGSRVLGVSKELKMARSHGEYTGVSLLRGKAHRVYGNICNEMQWRARTSLYYEDIYNMMIGKVDARAAHVAAGEYAEVDTPEDLQAAERVIERHF